MSFAKFSVILSGQNDRREQKKYISVVASKNLGKAAHFWPFFQFLPFLHILCTPMGRPMPSVHHFWVQAGVRSLVALISGETLRTFSIFFYHFWPIFINFAIFAHFAHRYRPPYGLGSLFLGTSCCVKYSCINFKWDIEIFFIFCPLFQFWPFFQISRILHTPMGHPMASVHHF